MFVIVVVRSSDWEACVARRAGSSTEGGDTKGGTGIKQTGAEALVARRMKTQGRWHAWKLKKGLRRLRRKSVMKGRKVSVGTRARAESAGEGFPFGRGGGRISARQRGTGGVVKRLCGALQAAPCSFKSETSTSAASCGWRCSAATNRTADRQSGSCIGMFRLAAAASGGVFGCCWCCRGNVCSCHVGLEIWLLC